VAVIIVGASFIYLFNLTSRPPNRVDETVAIDSSRHVVIPTATPVVLARELPIQEREIEVIGDHIAETALCLKKKQTGAALRALHQAEIAANRAVTMPGRSGLDEKKLLIIVGELESSERAIQRGSLEDALKQLDVSERKLDAITR